MNNIRNICIAISLFVHTSVISVLGAEGWLQRWIPVIPAPKSTEVSLQFVDSPDLKEKEAPDVTKDSKFSSDKTVKAKDLDEKFPEAPGKTKSKEIEESKQLAKFSKSLSRPVATPKELKEPKKPEETKEKKELEQDKESTVSSLEQPVPVEKTPEPEKDIAVTKQMEDTIKAVPSPMGDDMVDLPEVSEDFFSAPEKDIPSFEAQYHKIGPYFKEIKGMIEAYWLGYLIFKYPNTAPVESETTVSFRILPSGDVDGVDVIESSGDMIFRDFCVASVSNVAPYPPLPEDIDDLEEDGGLKIYFTFKYK